MNNYPIWWETTVTVFNKHVDDTQKVTWHKATLDNCFWKYTGDKVTVGNTTLETDNIVCRIPKSEKFIENYQWHELDESAKDNYFTLSVGDIIVKGKIDEDIDEYTKGKRSSDFVKKYKNLQGCLEIKQVAINVGKGRCNEHYYVKGI